MQKLTKKTEDVASKVGLLINAGKTKLMKIGVFEGEEVNTFQAEGGEIESVEEFCYLGSEVSRDGSYDKGIKIRLRKANATFGGLSNVWKSLKLKVKSRLYESLVSK